MMTVLRSLEGETLEEMIFRHYGRQHEDVLQAVLRQDDNKGIAAHGLILPAGTSVTLPDMPKEAPNRSVKRAQELWD